MTKRDECPSQGVPCPACGALGSGVKETRWSDRGLRRRRECVNCHARFSTLEVVIVPPNCMSCGRPMDTDRPGAIHVCGRCGSAGRTAVLHRLTERALAEGHRA